MSIIAEFFPRIERSFVQGIHKEWPGYISLIHHSVLVSGLILPYPVGSAVAAIGMWSGLICNIAHRFFITLGSQAKKLDRETEVLIGKLYDIRKMQEQDSGLCSDAKGYFETMVNLIDLAKNHLLQQGIDVGTAVDELSMRVRENQLIADQLRARFLRQQLLHAELIKECSRLRAIQNNGGNDYEKTIYSTRDVSRSLHAHERLCNVDELIV